MAVTIALDLLDERFSEVLATECPRERSVAYAQSAGSMAVDLCQQISELVWTSLTVPESFGGLGLGIDASSRLHPALGAVAAPVPMLGTTLTILLVAHSACDRQRAAQDGETAAAGALFADAAASATAGAPAASAVDWSEGAAA